MVPMNESQPYNVGSEAWLADQQVISHCVTHPTQLPHTYVRPDTESQVRIYMYGKLELTGTDHRLGNPMVQCFKLSLSIVTADVPPWVIV